MRTVKDRITQHNINAWGDTTEEAWITVNDCMYKILSKPDDAPLGSLDGGGTLNTWGVISGMASVYTCLVTPLRVSKMIGFENNSLWGGTCSSFGAMQFIMNQYGFAILDGIVAVIFITELILGSIITPLVTLKDMRSSRSTRFTKAGMYQKCIHILCSLELHEAVTFPRSNVIFLVSYLLRCMLGGVREVNHNEMVVGVPLTAAFGLLRLTAIFRALATISQLELSYTINKHGADSSTRLTMQVIRLVLGLAYTSHVVACLYLLVARIELGTTQVYTSSTELESAFFPDHTILGNENSILTSYLRCLHFAFTNLAGIGNNDSHPYSALECAFTLAVNAVGATLYAFTTGLLLSMIEPSVKRGNHFADSAAALKEFMIQVGMEADDQERIIHGLILFEMSGNKTRDADPFAPAPGEKTRAPAYPEDLVRNLPRFLQDELHTVALVDAMKRRERAFRRCSNEFLTTVASSLKQSTVLLPGDFIIQEGQNVPSQLMIVEEGLLEVFVDGSCIHKLERGDMISFHWVNSSKGISRRFSTSESTTFSPLLLCDNIAAVSVRAMDHCKIATGLTKDEKKNLKRRYTSDWNELVEVLDISRSEKKKTATSDQAAEDATIETQYNTSNSNGSHKTRNSITEKLRRISHIG